MDWLSKILDSSTLQAWLDHHASSQIVFTNGCFDLLHPGHLHYLSEAKALGDHLIIGVNDDASVQRLKGSTRPINALRDRMLQLAALAFVDAVISFEEDTPLRLIQEVNPSILVKGGDYAIEDIVGGDYVRSRGGSVETIPFVEGYSTTGLVERLAISDNKDMDTDIIVGKNTFAPFDYENYYHIYNRSNNQEPLFLTDDNRAYFLQKYKKFLSPYLHIHAYALLDNHFHFSVRVKSRDEILDYLLGLSEDERTAQQRRFLDSRDRIALSDPISPLISDQHRRFFISYTQSFNRLHGRTGNLFNARFKHSWYDPDKRFEHLVYYIHHNARHHRLVNDLHSFPHSSYHSIIQGDDALIHISELIDRFGSIEEFKHFHREEHLQSASKEIDID